MYIDMYNDKLFKAFFTCKEARGMVSSFLSAITGIKKEILINATYIGGLEETNKTKKQKGKRTDVIIKVDNYNRIIVEMNRSNNINIFEKNVRYAFALIDRTTKEGENNYSKVLLLNIDKFNKYHTRKPIIDFKIRSEDGIIESNIYHSIHLVVENFTKRNYNEVEKEIVKFIDFLKHTNLNEMKKDYKGDKEYMAGVIKLEDYMKDPDVYGLLYEEKTGKELAEEYYRDGISEGKRQGIEQGIEQKAKESAIKLHKKGVPDELIMNSLDINKEQLKKYLS